MTDTQATAGSALTSRLEAIERLAARLIHHIRRAHFFDSDSEHNCTIAADDLEEAMKKLHPADPLAKAAEQATQTGSRRDVARFLQLRRELKT